MSLKRLESDCTSMVGGCVAKEVRKCSTSMVVGCVTVKEVREWSYLYGRWVCHRRG